MRDKRVWDRVNKMPVYPKKSKTLTEEQVKRVMLDCVEVNTSCPESVRNYGERCEMVGELYYGYKNYMKSITTINTKKKASQSVIENINRLIGYKDEYIG